MPDDVAIIDTSCIIHVKRIVQREGQAAVYQGLSGLVTGDKLVYPKQVVEELERWSNPALNPQDLPLVWAKSNSSHATRHKVPFETVRDVLAQVSEIHDLDKPGVEEADPYVLALAIHLQEQGKKVTVLTEERKDRPDKMSMTTACGVLRLPCLPIETFLSRNGIWRRSS